MTFLLFEFVFGRRLLISRKSIENWVTDKKEGGGKGEGGGSVDQAFPGRVMMSQEPKKSNFFVNVENGLCLCFLLLLFLGLLHEGIGARNDFSGVSGMNEEKKGHNSQSLPANGRKKKNRKLRLFYAEGITIWEKGMCTFPLSLHFEKLFLRLYCRVSFWAS